jgi:hypothetical protein
LILAIDFDATVVVQDGRDYRDVETPLEFVSGVREALHALKRAGHILLLYSARANLALRKDPKLDPLVRAGARKVDPVWWAENRPVNEARYQHMVSFVETELLGVFDAVDDGHQGKPSADLFIDDKALRLGYGVDSVGWNTVARRYGEPEGGSDVKEER